MAFLINLVYLLFYKLYKMQFNPVLTRLKNLNNFIFLINFTFLRIIPQPVSILNLCTNFKDLLSPL